MHVYSVILGDVDTWAAWALEAGESLPVPSDPKQRLALEHSLPEWLVTELWGQIGAERTEAWAAASNRIPPIDLRCNRLRSSRDALLEQLPAEALAELPDGLTLTSRPVMPGGCRGMTTAATAPLTPPKPLCMREHMWYGKLP